ncbi:MAG: TonB-dependent receptor [Bacteroidales bacterium]|nr:TonB-dependent receptor [Bacteroidales bacterium]
MAGAVKKLCVLIILIFLIPPSGSFGQQNNPVISLNAINRSLESILTELTEISGYNFSYNPDKIPADTIISLTFSMKPLSEVLSSLESLGLSHRFMKNHIILRKKAVSPFSKNKVAKRRVTLSGYIRNDVTGETLIRATIADLSSGKGVATNGYGYYSFTIEPGRYDLCISYIGYKPDKISINLLSDTTILFNLVENISRLEEVIIITDNHDRTINRFASGEMEIRTSSIKNIPGILGESDVIKSFQTIPGINFYSDGSTIFHVRGGDRDQNMILIDEAPVYNPAHLLGIFSAFTPGSINNVKIFKGDMPASYGGRLSSVIDVKLKEGNRNNLAVSGNTSPVATTLNFEGPMFKKKSSFFISARRSHLKWLVASQTPSVEKLHFNDFNLKYNYRINSRNRIYLSYYSGLDIFLNHESESVSSGISWLNNAANIRWNHLFNDRLFSNTSLIISNYDYNLFTNYETKERWNTGISLSALKYDIAFYSSPGNIYKAGIFLATHFYSPGNYYVGSNAEPVTRGVSARKAVENAIYCSFENEITQKLNIRYGLRFTAWTNSGAAVEYVYNDNFFPIDTITYPKNRNYNTYTSLEPRIGLIYKLSKNFQGKIAWSRNSQFEFLISNSVSPFTSLEAWLPASPNIKPMRSNQITTGILFNSSNK